MTARTRLDAPRRRRGTRHRALATRLLLGLLVLLVLTGAWLALGLLEAAATWPPPSTSAVDSPRSIFATVDRNDRSPAPPKR